MVMDVGFNPSGMQYCNIIKGFDLVTSHEENVPEAFDGYLADAVVLVSACSLDQDGKNGLQSLPFT